MAEQKITFTATATIDGAEYTSTRTSARPYTHAAFHKSSEYHVNKGGQAYYATFHGSEANAAKSASDKACGEVFAIVEVTEVVKTTKRAAKVAEVKPAEAPKAPAKRAPRKAATTKVDPALAEIVQFVLGGAHTAKTENSKTVLNKAAGQLKAGKVEDARKTLYPIRTRVALKAIKMIKAL